MSAATLASSRREGPHPLPILAALLAVAVALIALARFDHRAHLPAFHVAPDEVFFAAEGGVAAPDEVGRGEAVRLPHRWRSTHERSVGWYTSLVPIRVMPDRPWALYLPDITVDTTVYLNGRLLGNALGAAEVRGRAGRRPLYLPVPPGAWTVGENVLRIRVNATPLEEERLPAFYLGLDATLGEAYAEHVFREVRVPLFIASALAFAALVMGVIWLQRRGDTTYGWFAAVCGCWSLLAFAEVIDLQPVRAWPPELAATLLLFVLALCVRRFTSGSAAADADGVTGDPGRGVLPTLVAVAFGAAILLQRQPLSLDTFLRVGCVAILVGAVARIVSNPADKGRLDRLFLGLALVTLLLLVLADSLHPLPVVAPWERLPSVALAAPVFVVFVGWRLIRDFVRSGNDLECLNAELESRIEARTGEIEAQHLRLRTLERDRVLAVERERIMAEIHDGMGAHLVSLLSLADSRQVCPTLLRAGITCALEDLRLMIDSLDPADDDLGHVLGMYRQRVARHLGDGDVKLVWEVGDTPPCPDLTPHKVLQILRIVQEAVSNALKYSGSREIHVRAGSRDGTAFVEIRDRGEGPGAADGPGGRGLANMRRRAASIGASLTMASDEHGFRVRLVLGRPEPGATPGAGLEPTRAVPAPVRTSGSHRSRPRARPAAGAPTGDDTDARRLAAV